MYREHRGYKKEVREILRGKKNIVLSNDLDSYISTSILQTHYDKDMEVVGYFNPSDIFMYKDKLNTHTLDTIGVDMTLYNSKIDCISNHVETVNGINYSNGISCNSHINNPYTDKSLFSTSLLLWSSLDIPLPKDDVGKMLLLSIDSTYLGYYSNFKGKITHYLKLYGLEELIDVLERYNKNDFKQLSNRYSYRASRIAHNDNSIKLDLYYKNGILGEILKILDLEYINIDNNFNNKIYLTNTTVNQDTFTQIVEKHPKVIFNYARIYRDSVVICYMDDKRNNVD